MGSVTMGLLTLHTSNGQISVCKTRHARIVMRMFQSSQWDRSCQRGVECSLVECDLAVLVRIHVSERACQWLWRRVVWLITGSINNLEHLACFLRELCHAIHQVRSRPKGTDGLTVLQKTGVARDKFVLWFSSTLWGRTERAFSVSAPEYGTGCHWNCNCS